MSSWRLCVQSKFFFSRNWYPFHAGINSVHRNNVHDLCIQRLSAAGCCPAKRLTFYDPRCSLFLCDLIQINLRRNLLICDFQHLCTQRLSAAGCCPAKRLTLVSIPRSSLQSIPLQLHPDRSSLQSPSSATSKSVQRILFLLHSAKLFDRGAVMETAPRRPTLRFRDGTASYICTIPPCSLVS